MTNLRLVGVIATILVSGMASAQSYPPTPTPVPPPPVFAPAPPAAVVPAPSVGTSTTTTTVAPVPEGDHRTTTITKSVDENGNEVTKKDTYREGLAHSTVTHKETATDPDGGTTTRSVTTTTHE